MSGTKRTEPTFQRNALAPALLAAAVLFLAPVLLTAGWGIVVLFVVAILANQLAVRLSREEALAVKGSQAAAGE